LIARARAFGQSIDLRPMSVGSPLTVVMVLTLQSQAIRFAVSRAMGLAPFIVGRFEGVANSEVSVAKSEASVVHSEVPVATSEASATNSEASTDTMT
jgi:hypothetical protein